jgi:multiple sugar transport system substrate-binding protein
MNDRNQGTIQEGPMTTQRRRIAIVATVAAFGLVLGACGSGSGDNTPSTTPTAEEESTPTEQAEAPTEDTAEPTDAPAGAPVTITWWGWAPAYEAAAAAFNAAHTDIQIQFEQISPGSQGGYDKLLTAVQAGNAPCLGQVGYETFTSFVAAGALEDVTDLVASQRGEFADWVWNQVGIEGKVFGIPVDIGTMAMFYRSDIFEAHGVDIPTTWTEYRAAAEALQAADPTIKIASLPTDAYNYSGYSWQAGAKWFETDSDAWKVTINSDANVQVAEYWQGLVDDGLAATYPSWDAALYSAWANGEVVTEVGAVWTSALLKDNAAESSGKWAVAPMPVWEGSDAVGNVGGGSNAIMRGCATPAEAVEAAMWLSTAPEAVSALIVDGGMYPAANSGLSSPDLAAGDEFFGGQAIFDVFSAETAKVNTDWQWGPVMPVTSSALADGLGAVGAGSGTIAEALAGAESKTIEEIQAQGFTIAQ